MPTYKDTDFLAISSRIRYLETKLLKRDAFERLLSCADDAEAVRFLTELGYGEGEAVADPSSPESVLEAEQDRVCRFVAQNVPTSVLTDVIRLPYDYLNIKAALKAERLGISPDRMTVSGGTIETPLLCEAVRKRDREMLTPYMMKAVEQALDASARSNDPQQIDLICDRVCYAEILDRAESSGMSFITEYITKKVDLINLLIFLRLKKIGKDLPFFLQTYIPTQKGLGEPFFAALYDRPLPDFMEALRTTPYAFLPEKFGTGTLPPMFVLERTVKKMTTDLLGQMMNVSFGPQIPFAYLIMKIEEIENVRIVLSSRAAGLDMTSVMERLSVEYV